jgi:transcription antitermination factor NusG
MPWMVLKTEPRREAIVTSQIIGLCGRSAYWPKFRDWKTGKIKSLFPSYIFAEHETENWSYWRAVFGVFGPIKLNGVPGVVSDKDIERLQVQEDSEGLILIDLEVGHRVQIVGGEYVGWHGIYQGMSSNQRCEILFNIIGTPLRKFVDTKFIRAPSLHIV